MFYHENLSTVSRGTGGKKGKQRDKIKAHIGREPTHTKLSTKEERKIVRTKGGGKKVKLKKALYANIEIEKGKFKKAKITNIIKSNNPDLTRRNVIVKGAIIQTELGKAIVTSRPGQDGVINAKLIKEK